jgi:hypothetical protein
LGQFVMSESFRVAIGVRAERPRVCLWEGLFWVRFARLAGHQHDLLLYVETSIQLRKQVQHRS